MSNRFVEKLTPLEWRLWRAVSGLAHEAGSLQEVARDLYRSRTGRRLLLAEENLIMREMCPHSGDHSSSSSPPRKKQASKR